MKHHDSGRRSHEHAHASHSSHDAHIRHSHDLHHKTHLHNAVRHLDEQHGRASPKIDSLEFGHYSHAGEPHPHEKADKPGV